MYAKIAGAKNKSVREEIEDELTGQTIAVVLAEYIRRRVLYRNNIRRCSGSIEGLVSVIKNADLTDPAR